MRNIFARIYKGKQTKSHTRRTYKIQYRSRCNDHRRKSYFKHSVVCVFLGQENTPILIYITAGFLIAMSAWQFQTLWRSFQLQKLFRQRKNETFERQGQNSESVFESVTTKELLNEPNFKDAIPASIIENTTKKLAEKMPRKSS